MKKSLMLVPFAMAGLVLGGLALAMQPGDKPAAQPPKPAEKPVAPKMDKKQLAAMMAMQGQPGPEHKVLQSMGGTFDATIEMNMMPGAPPLVAHATLESTLVLGGRFVQSVSRPAEGEDLKVESISYLGYDKRAKKYFWWAIDSTDTYSVHAQGDYDAASKTLTLLGENEEPGMGTMKFRTTFVLTDDDHRTMSLHFQANEQMKKMAPAGALDKDGWFPVMSMKLARKK